MDPAAEKVEVPERLIAAFLGIIQLDCLAIDHARSTMAAEIATGNDFDAALIWSSINTILSRAAGLSKCFWPPMMGVKADDKPLVVARGEELCDMFKMTETSPLHDRAVRNSVEHIDQRLHVWMAEIRPDSRIVDLIVGPEDVLDEDELRGHYVFRRFDYQNGVIHVGTDILPILPLFEESYRLYNLIPSFTSEPTAGHDWKYIASA